MFRISVLVFLALFVCANVCVWANENYSFFFFSSFRLKRCIVSIPNKQQHQHQRQSQWRSTESEKSPPSIDTQFYMCQLFAETHKFSASINGLCSAYRGIFMARNNSAKGCDLCLWFLLFRLRFFIFISNRVVLFFLCVPQIMTLFCISRTFWFLALTVSVCAFFLGVVLSACNTKIQFSF